MNLLFHGEKRTKADEKRKLCKSTLSCYKSKIFDKIWRNHIEAKEVSTADDRDTFGVVGSTRNKLSGIIIGKPQPIQLKR